MFLDIRESTVPVGRVNGTPGSRQVTVTADAGRRRLMAAAPRLGPAESLISALFLLSQILVAGLETIHLVNSLND